MSGLSTKQIKGKINVLTDYADYAFHISSFCRLDVYAYGGSHPRRVDSTGADHWFLVGFCGNAPVACCEFYLP